jgi:hypothetical protein
VGVVHGLEGDAGVIAVEVTVLDEIFDGFDDLASPVSIKKSTSASPVDYTFFSRFACSNRASSTEIDH